MIRAQTTRPPAMSANFFRALLRVAMVLGSRRAFECLHGPHCTRLSVLVPECGIVGARRRLCQRSPRADADHGRQSDRVMSHTAPCSAAAELLQPTTSCASANYCITRLAAIPLPSLAFFLVPGSFLEAFRRESTLPLQLTWSISSHVSSRWVLREERAHDGRGLAEARGRRGHDRVPPAGGRRPAGANAPTAAAWGAGWCVWELALPWYAFLHSWSTFVEHIVASPGIQR